MPKNFLINSLKIRTRILLWTLFISVTPLLALYLMLTQVLESTSTLLVKDAGDYAERKTSLLRSTIHSDLEDSLQATAEMTAEFFKYFYTHTDGNRDESLNETLSIIENEATIHFIFDEQGRLVRQPALSVLPISAYDISEAETFLKANNYLCHTVKLEPTNLKLLTALSVSLRSSWHETALQFQHDFAGDVRAKVDQAISWVYMIALSLFMGLGLIALLLSRWLTNIITRPLENLSRAMDLFDGSRAVQLMAEREDEIGSLTDKFVEMTNKLIAARDELSWQQAALERADRELMNLNLTLEERIEERTSSLAQALEKLRELDKNKDEFLGLISHELKTPLTSISASAEALLSTDLKLTQDGRRRFLQIIQNEADRLGRLINELLDMTRLEAGRMPLHYKRTDLTDLVREIMEAHRTAIERKGLTLDLEIADNPLLRTAVVDADRFVQVLTNLVSNAYKFTTRGRITVNLDILEIGDRQAIRLIVADTGIGIDPKDAPKVFDRFQQIERFDTHHEGWGLGMPISRMLVESMGGEIHFASKVNHGTAFTVTLPLEGSTRDIDD